MTSKEKSDYASAYYKKNKRRLKARHKITDRKSRKQKSAKAKVWRDAHKKERSVYKKKHYKKNKKRILRKQNRTLRKKMKSRHHRKVRQTYMHGYNQENKEALSVDKKKYYKQNKKARLAYQKIHRLKAYVMKRIAKYDKTAKRRLAKIEERALRGLLACNLDIDDLLFYRDKYGNWAPCYYCVEKAKRLKLPKSSYMWKPLDTIRFDRWVSKRGYAEPFDFRYAYRRGNIVPCCTRHNYDKRNRTGSDFLGDIVPDSLGRRNNKRKKKCPVWHPQTGTST